MDYVENEFLNQRYSILSPTSTRKMKIYAVVPAAYYPTPQKENYQEGFIIRAFAKRISDDNSGIIEVEEGQLFTLKQNIFYKTTVIKWRITGDKYNIMDGNRVDVTGASEYNYDQRTRANNIIPGIVDKLPDLLQFYRLT